MKGRNHEPQALIYTVRCNYGTRYHHRAGYHTKIGTEHQTQNNWFEKIRCRVLQVVDKDGNIAIELQADELESGITIFDKQGNRVIFLNVDELIGNHLSVSDFAKIGRDSLAC